MPLFLWLVACVWLAHGAVAIIGAKSALHEILGCLSLSFGVVFIALAAILVRLDRKSSPQAPAIVEQGISLVPPPVPTSSRVRQRTHDRV